MELEPSHSAEYSVLSTQYLVPGKQLKRRFRWTLFLVSFLTATAQSARTAEPSRAEFGLDRRVPWTTSRLVGSPDPPPKYVAERVFPSLTFEAPCELAAIPGTNRLVVVEVNGKLFSFENRPAASHLAPDLFADLKAIDPKF